RTRARQLSLVVRGLGRATGNRGRPTRLTRQNYTIGHGPVSGNGQGDQLRGAIFLIPLIPLPTTDGAPAGSGPAAVPLADSPGIRSHSHFRHPARTDAPPTRRGGWNHDGPAPTATAVADADRLTVAGLDITVGIQFSGYVSPKLIPLDPAESVAPGDSRPPARQHPTDDDLRRLEARQRELEAEERARRAEWGRQ